MEKMLELTKFYPVLIHCSAEFPLLHQKFPQLELKFLGYYYDGKL